MAVKISLANADSAQKIAFTNRRKELLVLFLLCLLLRASSSSADGSLKVDTSDECDDDEFKEEKERDAPRKPFKTTRAFVGLSFFLKSSSLFLISVAR